MQRWGGCRGWLLLSHTCGLPQCSGGVSGGSERTQCVSQEMVQIVQLPVNSDIMNGSIKKQKLMHNFINVHSMPKEMQIGQEIIKYFYCAMLHQGFGGIWPHFRLHRDRLFCACFYPEHFVRLPFIFNSNTTF